MTQKLQPNHLSGIYTSAVNSNLNKFYIFWSTGFLTGFIKKAQGTVGAIVGTIIFLLLANLDIKLQIIIFLTYFLISFKSISYGIFHFRNQDPPQINSDEIIGMWVALIFFEPTFKIIFLAFILFRLLDILKPFPINQFEKLPGATGVILDDIIAGLLTKGLIWIFMRI